MSAGVISPFRFAAAAQCRPLIGFDSAKRTSAKLHGSDANTEPESGRQRRHFRGKGDDLSRIAVSMRRDGEISSSSRSTHPRRCELPPKATREPGLILPGDLTAVKCAEPKPRAEVTGRAGWRSFPGEPSKSSLWPADQAVARRTEGRIKRGSCEKPTDQGDGPSIDPRDRFLDDLTLIEPLLSPLESRWFDILNGQN
ncbi:hypothetical protein KM043_012028 [Ampulex compressa]|nr:hypothetical protein KM043_012028 [Ampulex compressa]